MRAPTNKPTEKTEKRLANTSTNKPAVNESQYVKVDIQSVIQKMLEDGTLQNELSKEATKQLTTRQAVNTVKNILSEYFDCFMLMGYGVDGRRTIIRHSKTDRDEDSIVELLRYVLIRIMQNEN